MITDGKRSFSDAEYNRLDKRVDALFLSILTFMMVFFVANEREYREEAMKTSEVKIAGYAGSFYVVAAICDAVVRSRFSQFRVFSLIRLISAYVTLALLGFVIFAKNTNLVGFWVVAGITAIVGITSYIAYLPSARRSSVDPRLAPVINRLGREADRRLDVLHIATIIGILLKPNLTETDDLYQRVITASNRSPEGIRTNQESTILHHTPMKDASTLDEGTPSRSTTRLRKSGFTGGSSQIAPGDSDSKAV